MANRNLHHASILPSLLAVSLAVCTLLVNTFSFLIPKNRDTTAETAYLSSLYFPVAEYAPADTNDISSMPMDDQEALYEWLCYNMGFSGIPLETAPAMDAQIKIACVGDSITYGYGLMDWTRNNYPTLLQDLLGDRYHVQNFGANGACVQQDTDHPYTNYNVYPDVATYEADILVFMMGSNDSKPENWKGESAFRVALCTMLDNYSDAQIILCTPAVCYEVEPPECLDDGIGYELQADVLATIARIIREVAAERNYPLVDIHALTSENPQWLENDGVHPNHEGSAAIAEAVLQAVVQIDLP